MAKFEAGAWLTLEEELLCVVAEKSGKRRKVLLLTNRRLIIVQHTGPGWRLVEDRLWKEFTSVSVEHRSWGNSFLDVHFHPQAIVEEGLWSLRKVERKAAIMAYKMMKERELKRRETPPPKPKPAAAPKSKEIPLDPRYVINIDSKECKAEQLLRESKGKLPPLKEETKKPPVEQEKKEKDGKSEEGKASDSSTKGEAKDAPTKDAEKKSEIPANETPEEKELRELRAEGVEALKKKMIDSIKEIFSKK